MNDVGFLRRCGAAAVCLAMLGAVWPGCTRSAPSEDALGEAVQAQGSCGAKDHPCCTTGDPCNSDNLICAAGPEGPTCQPCGGGSAHSAELCCAGDTCRPGRTCEEGVCLPPCGKLGTLCCGNSICESPNLACDLDGVCSPCSGAGQVCCVVGPECQPGLQCFDRTCVCGGPGMVCCNGGDPCQTGLTCNGTTCEGACGGENEPCCGLPFQCEPGLSCLLDTSTNMFACNVPPS